MNLVRYLLLASAWFSLPAIPAGAIAGMLQGTGGVVPIAAAWLVCWVAMVLGCLAGRAIPRRMDAWGRYVVGLLTRAPLCLAGAVAAVTLGQPGSAPFGSAPIGSVRVILFWTVLFYLWALVVEVRMLLRELADERTVRSAGTR